MKEIAVFIATSSLMLFVQASALMGEDTADFQNRAATILDGLGAIDRTAFYSDGPVHRVVVILADDAIDDAAVQTVLQVPELFELQILGGAVTDLALAKCGEHMRLERLVVIGCDVSDRGVSAALKAPRLKRLTVAGARAYLPSFNPAGIHEQGRPTIARIKGQFLGEAVESIEALSLVGTGVDDRRAEGIRGWSGLKSIDLGHTRISDATLKTLSGTHVRRISATACRISESGVRALATSRDLRKLSIDGTPVGDECEDEIGLLRRLEVLDVSGTRMSDTAVERLREQLPFCDIRSTNAVRLSGVSGPHVPVEAAYARAVYVLSQFDGVRIRIDEQRVYSVYADNPSIDLGQYVLRFSDLTELGLSGEGVTDDVGDTVARLTDLERLSLQQSEGVTNSIGRAIEQCSKLRQVSLRATKVDDGIVAHLKRLDDLEIVDLRGTSVSTQGVKILKRHLPRVQVQHDDGGT